MTENKKLLVPYDALLKVRLYIAFMVAGACSSTVHDLHFKMILVSIKYVQQRVI